MRAFLDGILAARIAADCAVPDETNSSVDAGAKILAESGQTVTLACDQTLVRCLRDKVCLDLGASRVDTDPPILQPRSVSKSRSRDTRNMTAVSIASRHQTSRWPRCTKAVRCSLRARELRSHCGEGRSRRALIEARCCKPKSRLFLHDPLPKLNWSAGASSRQCAGLGQTVEMRVA